MCEVELHARGTRLTVRSMLTVINHTRRLLIADLVGEGEQPTRHLGLLPPGGSLPLSEACLESGLRFLDAGAEVALPKSQSTPQAASAGEGGDHEALRVASSAASGAGSGSHGKLEGKAEGNLEGKDEGKAPPLMWLPALMSSQVETVRPSADEEAAWRSLFSRPSRREYLLRSPISCSLGEASTGSSAKAGDLYLGSHALHFRAGAGTLLVASRKGKKGARHSRCRMRALGGFRSDRPSSRGTRASHSSGTPARRALVAMPLPVEASRRALAGLGEIAPRC